MPSIAAGTSKPFGTNVPPCSNTQEPKAGASSPSWKPQTSPTPASNATGNRGVRINRQLGFWCLFYLWILGFADAPGTGMSGNVEHCQVGRRDSNVTASPRIKAST